MAPRMTKATTAHARTVPSSALLCWTTCPLPDTVSWWRSGVFCASFFFLLKRLREFLVFVSAGCFFLTARLLRRGVSTIVMPPLADVELTSQLLRCRILRLPQPGPLGRLVLCLAL